MKPYTLNQRADLFNSAYPQLPPLVVHKGFLYGYWFTGGGNISGFYGSFQQGFIGRVDSMFPDCKGKHELLHLFSGSMPASPDYTRVGNDPTGQYQTDLQIDAHQLSSFLNFKPALIISDPPYSVEDSEHYKNSMVDRARIVSECAACLRPGGWLLWLDQALPIFSNNELRMVGCISYIRSTGNRYRCITIFQRPVK